MLVQAVASTRRRGQVVIVAAFAGSWIRRGGTWEIYLPSPSVLAARWRTRDTFAPPRGGAGAVRALERRTMAQRV